LPFRRPVAMGSPMYLNIETMRVMGILQSIFAVVLLSLFWILHSRFRRANFLLLWCCAWAAYAVGLIAGYLPPLVGMAPGAGRDFFAWLFTIAGFVHAALVYLGTRAFARESRGLQSASRWVLVAALGGSLVFFISVSLLPTFDRWMGQAGNLLPLQPVAFRVILRQSLIAAAYLVAAAMFWRRRANSRLPGPSILTAACFFYGLFQFLFVANLLPQIRVAIPRMLPVPPYFVDLSCQVLFGLGIVLYLLDEYRRVLEARGEVEARFGGVAQSLAEGLLITDPEDVILFANARIAQMTGYTVSELVGRPGYALLIPEKDWPVLWKKNKERMTGTVDRYEIEILRKDGSTLWVEISASPYRDISGQTIGTLGAVTDITERRRFAQALAASEEKFSKAFLSSPDAVAISTLAEGRYIEVNESFCAMTEYARESLIGRSAMELGIWKLRENRDRLVALLKTQKRVREFSMQFRGKSGTMTEGVVSAEVIDIAGEPCLLTITRDVTKQKRAERLQAVLYEIMQAADSAPTSEALFREVHRIIQQVMPAENFYIALYDEAQNLLTYPYFVDAHDQPAPPGPPGRGNTAYVLRNGVSLLSPANVHEELKQKGEVETVGAMSEVWLGVPLKVAGKCIGVMAAQHYQDRAAFGEREQRILEFVSAQVATAIHRKQSDEALRRSEEKFSRAFHCSPDGMTISNFDDSRFIEVNESFLRLTGFPRQEVIGHTSLDLNLWVDPFKRPEMSSAVRQTGRVQDFEFELRKKSGEVVIGLLSVDIIEVAGRKCFLSVVRDITARKRMEEVVRQSEAKFSKAFFASPDAMVLSRMDTGLLVDVNEGFSRLTGFSREEAIGNSGQDLQLWSSQADRSRVIELLRQGRGIRNMELAFRSRAGRALVGLLSAEVIEFGGTQCMLVVVRDITERKEMEEAIRTSEERFRELFENANDIVYTHDLDGNFTSLNSTGERITGYTRAEAMQMNMKDLLSAEQFEFARRMIAVKAEGQGSTTYELQIRSKSGQIVDIEVSTRIIQFNGRPVGVQGIARDITDRRRAQNALRESEERYRLLFHHSPLPMFVYDISTLAFLAANEAAVRSYGYSRSELLAMNLRDIRPPEERPYLEHRLEISPLDQHAAVHRKKDGTLIDVEVRAHSIDWFGKAARLAVVEDITERVRAEAAIRDSEAKFRALAESSPYAIVIARETRVVFANRAAEEITGYSFAELAEMDAATILSPESQALVQEKRTERRKGRHESQRYEVKFTTKNKVEKWLDITSSEISFEGAPAILVNAMDVTERKGVEDQLRQAQKMEAVGRLAGGVAHDFNNLLMIMRGYADLIMDSESADASTRRNAEQITRAAERAAGLTQQLLAFSRKQVLALQVLDLPGAIRDTESMLVRLIGEDVELSVKAAPDLWRVKADPNQLEQVILNLAINARDAMPKGGKLMMEMRNVELDAFFLRQHAGATAGPHVMLSVTDTGSGMTPEVRARVFEPFFTTKEVGRGTGLGLATVYGIVKQSSGYITVYSEPEKGTTFSIYLPKAEPAAREPVVIEHKTHGGGHETILLVEDQTEVRALARQLLDSRGYRVLEAQDGKDALKVSRAHDGHIDLLLTDVVMPGMSGRELAEQLCQVRPGIKVIYVSGYTAEAIGHHGILDPGTEFLQKPFSGDALARKLREVLDNSQ